MDGKLEAVKYVPARMIRNVVEKHKFVVEPSAEKVISSAKDDDVLSIRLTINSPLRIIRAANITQNPKDIFAVAEN